MRPAAGLALALVLAAGLPSETRLVAQPPSERPRGAPETEREGRPRRSYADPSAVIAADLALGRIARDKGQWRAWREAAAPGAVLFAPRAVDATAWLKRRAEPAAPERWQPRTVWMSCDGGHAVSQGVWSRGAASGGYVAVWERQEKGDWKWLLREEGPAADLGEAPEMISGRVADCAGLPRRRRPGEPPAPIDPADAVSSDRSLRWSVRVAGDCGRSISVAAWDGKVFAAVYEVRHDPPSGGCG
jgi:hypothetical protein